MKTRPHSALPLRLGAVTLLAAGLVWCGAGAHAATPPLPVPSLAPVPSSAPAPLPAPSPAGPVGDPVDQLTSAVQQALRGVGAPSGQPSSPAPSGTTATGNAPTGTPSSGQPASGSPSTGSRSASSQSAASQRTASPAGVQAQTPAASVCLIPTGTASPAFAVSLSAVGQDLSSPLVEQFPQVFTACPARTVAASPDEVIAVDAVVRGLVGACVRVTRQVAPLRTTLVVLDHDLISELTKAGVPLDKLVVPCPSGATAGAPGGTAGPGNDPSAAAPRSSTGGVSSVLPDRLAFTGASDPRPLLLTGATLLALGVVLTRKARLLTVAA